MNLIHRVNCVRAFCLLAVATTGTSVGHTQTIEQPGVQRVAVRKLLLSVDANPKTSSDYLRGSREEAIRLLKSTRATHFHTSATWSAIEKRAGTLELTELKEGLAASAPLPVAFTLKIIDAGQRRMPDAYKAMPWDSPGMVRRITEIIEQIAPLLGRRPWSYAIGNEIDMYFAQRPQEIAAYGRLLEQLKPVVAALHPTASFTTVWQFSSIAQLRTTFGPIARSLDHVGVTYYALNPDFSVGPVDKMARDLPTALAITHPLPIAFQELGYPSAALLGSSPERQAEFMRVSFEAIRAAGTTQVLGATYLFQSDLPQWLVNDFVIAYGLDNERFRAFLTTLGLRDQNDRAKPGWQEFLRQLDIARPPPTRAAGR
jgi:hypothetical protein